MISSRHEEFIYANFTVRGRNGEELDVLCPVHGDKNASLRVNVAKGVFFCHGCKEKGSIGKLAKLAGLRYSYDRTEQDMSVLLSKLAKLKDMTGKGEQIFCRPESDLQRFQHECSYWTDPLSEGGRGLTPETVDLFDLGYDPFEDAVTIPARDETGCLHGFTRRYLDPEAELRYKDSKGFDKKHNLFGSWMAASTETATVVLTEGPIDAIKIWQAGHVGLAQYGSHLTDHQITLLRRMGTLKVVLFYDNDREGKRCVAAARGYTEYKKDGWKYTPEHDLRRFFVLSTVSYDEADAKDPGALEDGMIDTMICNARYLR